MFEQFIKDLLIDPSTVTQDVFNTMNRLYPANDSSLGGEFNTGDSLFDRAEAWYTDNMYLAPRRNLFNRAANLQPLFGYFFREFIPGQDPSRGGVWCSVYICTSLTCEVQCSMLRSSSCCSANSLKSNGSSRARWLISMSTSCPT